MGFFLGGGEIQPIRMANAMKKRGLKVMFFSLDIQPRDPKVRSMLSSDIPVYCPSTLPEKNLHPFLRQNRIHVVNTHGPYTEFYFVKHLKNNDVPIIATMHGGYESFLSDLEFNGLGCREFMKELAAAKKRINKWIYIAENNLRHFQDTYESEPSRFIKISNGFNTDETPVYKIHRESLGISKEAFVCISCSRAIEEKGWLESVEVVNRAREITGKDIHLILLGNGPLYEKMKADKTPSHVHLLGFRENVLDYIAGADLMLFPTYFAGESVPLSIIEALSLGKPVISTDVGEIQTMLMADTCNPAGIITPLTPERKPDVASLTQALVSVVNDSELYSQFVGNTSRAVQQFDMDECVQRYISCFNEVVASQDTMECCK
jgi:glycosyltransferase involved in cell wall biosynthesis